MIARTVIGSLFGGGALPLIVVAAIAGAFGTGYLKGRASASQKAVIEKLEGERDRLTAEREQLDQQLRIARQAITDINRKNETDAREIGALRTKVDAYEEQLDSEGGAFVLGPDDAQFLRGIR